MRDRSFLVVTTCFFLSGVAALVYETAWTREFSFVFGTSDVAVATVLAAYMAGLAGGAAIGGRIAHRTRRPLALYGLLELGIAIAALLVPTALYLATQLLIAIFGGQSGFHETNPLAISIFYLVVTFAIVMVPTAFMGATLPLLSRHAVRHDLDIGPRIGALYAVNTAGAVVGTLFAAFVLLPALGIRQTVHVAVAINALVFVVAIYLVRIARLDDDVRAEPEAQTQDATRPFHFILPLMLLSGALSFTYEVLWVRLLSQLLGGSIYAFATMLASFLLGIALGSAAASRLAQTAGRALRGFVWAQIGIAVLCAAAFSLIDYAPALTRLLALDSPLVLDVTTAVLVLLPSAVCIGATFPFAVRIVARNAQDAGPATARVYSWNTIGAIVGSIGAAFVLLPELGFRGTILLGLTLNLAIAALASLLGGRSRRALALPACAWVVLLAVLPGEPWQILRTSPFSRNAPPKSGRVDFYEVGRGATVLLTTHSPARWRMSTNGLPESMISSPADPPITLKPAVMLGNLGPMLRPEARSMLVVGLGGGVTVEHIPRNIDRIDVIEIEDEVIAANRWLRPHRAMDPLSDPRVHVHRGDARSTLQLNDQRFDVIAAQASHPWTGGASHLYTSEFFSLVADHLHDEGVFVQWVGHLFVDVDLLKNLVATLLERFRYVHVYSGVLFVASNSPIPPAPDLERLRDLDPEISQRTGLYTPEQFATHLRMDTETSRRFAAGAERTSDDRNLLQMRSPMITRGDAKARSKRLRDILDAFSAFDPLAKYAAQGLLDPVALFGHLHTAGQARRATTLLETIEQPRDRDTVRLLYGSTRSSPSELETHLQSAPDDDRVRAKLLKQRLANTSPDKPIGAPAPGLTWNAFERAVIRATRAAGTTGGTAAAPFEPVLREIPPTHPLYLNAVHLRTSWRIGSRNPERLAEALAIADEAYLVRQKDALLLLRAQVGQAMNDPLVTLASLARVEETGRSSNQALQDRIRALLRQTDAEGDLAAWRDRLLHNKFRKKPANSASR
ncbi:MAG: hypothetical protein GY733_23665 [bacterium]|nr:hypothetical protein [bacterium]